MEQTRHKGFYETLNGKHVVVTLQTGESITGVLRADNYNVYDVVLDCKNESFLIPKSCIVKVMFSGGAK